MTGKTYRQLLTVNYGLLSTYCALATLFGYSITPYLNEVKRIDAKSLYQAYQITCLTTKVKSFSRLPKWFVLSGILSGVKQFIMSNRRGKFPYFKFENGILEVSSTNSNKAFLFSLNAITNVQSRVDRKLSATKTGSVQETLSKLIKCFLFRWAKRRSSFLLSELIRSINAGLLPLFNYLKKWKLGAVKSYHLTKNRKAHISALDYVKGNGTKISWVETNNLFQHITLPPVNLGIWLLTKMNLPHNLTPFFSLYEYQKFDTSYLADEICIKLIQKTSPARKKN